MCGKLKAMTSSRSIMSVSSGFSVGKMTNLPFAFAGTSIMANLVSNFQSFLRIAMPRYKLFSRK